MPSSLIETENFQPELVLPSTVEEFNPQITQITADSNRKLSTQARDPAPHYQHSQIGYNYRLSNLLAALGRGQLERLDEKVARRRAINEFYRNALQEFPGIEFMPEAPYGRSNCWLTLILITPEKFGADREEVRLALEKENNESRPIWPPAHRAYASKRNRGTCSPASEGRKEKGARRETQKKNIRQGG